MYIQTYLHTCSDMPTCICASVVVVGWRAEVKSRRQDAAFVLVGFRVLSFRVFGFSCLGFEG